MLDHVAIWVIDAPAVPLPNLSTLAASISFSFSMSNSCQQSAGVRLVMGLMRPFFYKSRDFGVLNPADGWSSIEALHNKPIVAS